ncbi:MAG TPA: VOC family protein, partial [Steroidobacteraceae bacterium]|nr:VOC family protein [Steroidobacteraceae bacterium]
FSAAQVPAHWQSARAGGIHQGIDHSALSVADANRSVEFYQSLGLAVSNRTVNQGAQQEQLDGVHNAVVDVISLAPSRPTPHVELLHYRSRSRPAHAELMGNDTAAIRLIFATEQSPAAACDRLLRDPDGHLLQITR